MLVLTLCNQEEHKDCSGKLDVGRHVVGLESRARFNPLMLHGVGMEWASLLRYL